MWELSSVTTVGLYYSGEVEECQHPLRYSAGRVILSLPFPPLFYLRTPLFAGTDFLRDGYITTPEGSNVM